MLNQCVAKFWSQPFSLAVLFGVPPSARPCLVSRLCEAVVPLSLREMLFGPDPARSIVAQIEKCNQVL